MIIWTYQNLKMDTCLHGYVTMVTIISMTRVDVFPWIQVSMNTKFFGCIFLQWIFEWMYTFNKDLFLSKVPGK